MSHVSDLNRRRVLRGMLGGSAVTVGLPFLNCFLNTHGTALADGAQLPVSFATWFWGCGLNPGRWEPAQVGKFDPFDVLAAMAVGNPGIVDQAIKATDIARNRGDDRLPIGL